ncbi:MAG: glycosyltransferase family protein [Myxococcaceae bacterium]
MAAAASEGADYVFLCDQDDVWKPSKLGSSLATMVELERRFGDEGPLLVHTDLIVTDERLRPLHPSMLAHQGLHHEAESPLEVLLVQNFVTGCATVVNRALLRLALPLPDSCPMHDWWLALCAAASGHLGFVPEPSVWYRQHSGNEVGASGYWANLNPLHPVGRRRWARSGILAAAAIRQAADLHQRLLERGLGSDRARSTLSGFAGMSQQSPLARIRTLGRLGVHQQSQLRNLLMKARFALLPGLRAPGSALE